MPDKFDSKPPASRHLQVLKNPANVTRSSLSSNSEGDRVPSSIWPLFSSMTAGYRREDVPVTTVFGSDVCCSRSMAITTLKTIIIMESSRARADLTTEYCSGARSLMSAMATPAKYEIEPLRLGRSRLCRRLTHYRVGLLCSSIFTKTVAY